MKFINLGMLNAFVVAASLAAFSGPAQAVLIGGTDVGSLDTVIGAVDSSNSGQATEEQLLEAAILAATGTAVDVTLASNVNNPTMVSEGGNNYIDVFPRHTGILCSEVWYRQHRKRHVLHGERSVPAIFGLV